MKDLVAALKAAGEPSRLRILEILSNHELSVSELVQVLGQSQPRISRHLRVLADAGLVRRHAEGTSALFRIEREGNAGRLVRSVLDLADPDTPDRRNDQRRLDVLVAARRRQADEYFGRHAADWDRIRGRHVPDHDIEAAVVDLLARRGVRDLLDLGTGTGRILEVAGPRVRRGIGIDLSREMLAIARDRLEQAALHHCEVRHGDIVSLDLPAGSVDGAVFHLVLHFLDNPGDAIAEAARTLRAGGLMVVVDFAPHDLVHLREDFAHRRLGFSDDEMALWFTDAGLEDVSTRAFTRDQPDEATGDTLTVRIWTATQRADAPSTYDLEVAS